MKLDEHTYKRLALGGKKVNFEGILNPLLITRVSGTKTHATAQKVKISCRIPCLIFIARLFPISST